MMTQERFKSLNAASDEVHHSAVVRECLDEISRLQSLLSQEREANLNNVAISELQIKELKAQLAKLTWQRDRMLEICFPLDKIMKEEE